MNLDNLLRSLNKYLVDIFDTFGGQSKEYMNAMKQVKEALPEKVLQDTARQGLDYEGDAPEEPLQLSRGKASRDELEVFKEDLQQLRNTQKDTGTARRQSQKYIDDAEARNIKIKDKAEYIRTEAQHKYDFDNSTNDWYDEVMAHDYISDDWKEKIRDKYSQLHDDYEDAVFRDELERMVKVALRRGEVRKRYAERHAEPEPEPETPPSGVGYAIEDDFGGGI